MPSPVVLTETMSVWPGIPPVAVPEPGFTPRHAAPMGAAVNWSVLPAGSPFETVSACAGGICPGRAENTSDAGDGTSEGPNVRLQALRPCVEMKSLPALLY